MQYIDYLTKQPSDKDAIIINGDCYTYGKLYALVKDAREHLPRITEKHLYPIRETGILKQLILFLACAGTNQVPVIVPVDSKLEVTYPLYDYGHGCGCAARRIGEWRTQIKGSPLSPVRSLQQSFSLV